MAEAADEDEQGGVAGAAETVARLTLAADGAVRDITVTGMARGDCEGVEGVVLF